MPVERVIYVVVDVDEVPVQAFMNREVADAVVLEQPDLHVIPVPLGPVEGSDGS